MDIERFKRVYNTLPEREKETPIAIVDEQKITWEMALKEIDKKTELGKKIFRQLEELGVI